MTSLGTSRLATVTKDKKNGFRTFNELEISYIRQVQCADYEKSDPEAWWLTFGDSLWVLKWKKVYFESRIRKLHEKSAESSNKRVLHADSEKN